MQAIDRRFLVAAEHIPGVHQLVPAGVAAKVEHEHRRLRAPCDRPPALGRQVEPVDHARKRARATAHNLRVERARLRWPHHRDHLDPRIVEALGEHRAVAEIAVAALLERVEDLAPLIRRGHAGNHRCRVGLVAVQDLGRVACRLHGRAEGKRPPSPRHLRRRRNHAVQHGLALEHGREVALVQVAGSRADRR